jgi:general secretion pathway protein A
MYENFYGLREKPFALSPDPEYLYLSTHHRHTLTLLDYAIAETAGFVLVTGDVGCGKTTVMRHFLNRSGAGLSVGVLSNTHSSLGPLLPWIVEALGLDIGTGTTGDCYRRFLAHAKREYAQGRRILLVIDEAQNLSVEQLEELRVLSNLNADKQMLLQTVLVGQPELRDTLGRTSLRQFAQRILADYHLGPLMPGETQSYVRHRLKVAGGRTELFSTEAIARVHDSATGIPRLINVLCDTALIYGYADQSHAIDTDIIGQVLRDRANSVLPLASTAKIGMTPALAG